MGNECPKFNKKEISRVREKKKTKTSKDGRIIGQRAKKSIIL